MIVPTPDAARLLTHPVRYAGDAKKDQVLALPHGALLCRASFPVLFPVPRETGARPA